MTGLDAALPKVSCLDAVTMHSPCGTQDSWLSLLRYHLHQLLAEHCHRDCRERTGMSIGRKPGCELLATCSHQPIYPLKFQAKGLDMVNTGNWNQLTWVPQIQLFQALSRQATMSKLVASRGILPVVRAADHRMSARTS